MSKQLEQVWPRQERIRFHRVITGEKYPHPRNGQSVCHPSFAMWNGVLLRKMKDFFTKHHSYVTWVPAGVASKSSPSALHSDVHSPAQLQQWVLQFVNDYAKTYPWSPVIHLPSHHPHFYRKEHLYFIMEWSKTGLTVYLSDENANKCCFTSEDFERKREDIRKVFRLWGMPKFINDHIVIHHINPQYNQALMDLSHGRLASMFN